MIFSLNVHLSFHYLAVIFYCYTASIVEGGLEAIL